MNAGLIASLAIHARMNTPGSLETPFYKISEISREEGIIHLSAGEDECRNPNLAKCGGEAQHLEKLGIWSPPGLLNVRSSTAGPKTTRIGVFLKSLERS